jgi:hypothetical protein
VAKREGEDVEPTVRRKMVDLDLRDNETQKVWQPQGRGGGWGRQPEVQ